MRVWFVAAAGAVLMMAGAAQAQGADEAALRARLAVDVFDQLALGAAGAGEAASGTMMTRLAWPEPK